MNLPRPVYIAIRIVIPLLILAGGYSGFRYLAGLSKPPERSRPEADLPLVRTAPAKAHSGLMTIRLDGTVVPHREIGLSAEVAGRVVQKSGDGDEEVRAGRFVKKGQVLIRIDPQDYDLEVARQDKLHSQAAASIKETDAEIANSRQQIMLLTEDQKRAISDLEKVKTLRGMGAATESNQDDAEQTLRGAKSTLTREENNLAVLQAKLTRLKSARDLAETEKEKAQLDRTRCTITSPCDGIIVEDHVELDSFVQRGAMLLKVQDTSAAEVRTSLRVDDIYWLWQHKPGEGLPETPRSEWEIPNVPVHVKFEMNDATFRWEGRLARHEGPGLDERTRTVPCRVIVSNPTAASLETVTDTPTVRPPALFRGMFVTVELRTSPQEELIEIPEKAIRPGGVVWIVKDGKLKRIAVRVARVFAGRALIHAAGSGIEEGEEIVVSPLSTETSGMSVRTQSESGGAGDETDKQSPSPDETKKPKRTRETSPAGASE